VHIPSLPVLTPAGFDGVVSFGKNSATPTLWPRFPRRRFGLPPPARPRPDARWRESGIGKGAPSSVNGVRKVDKVKERDTALLYNQALRSNPQKV
jgi:hypothetical protein